jgi:ferredoxin-NADP reductase
MIRHRSATSDETPARLLYSSRTLEDVIYRDELARIEGDGLEVVHTLTREQPDSWRGLARRVDREMLVEVSWDAVEHPLVYVCGPTRFVETVASSLADLGHERDRIKTERFGPTGGDDGNR